MPEYSISLELINDGRINEYPCDIMVIATPTDIPENCYVYFLYEITNPSVASDIKTNLHSGILQFRLISPEDFSIRCTSTAFTYNEYGQRVIVSSVVRCVKVKETTSLIPYLFDVEPAPENYDSDRVVSEGLTKTTITADLEVPEDIPFEQPYYIPVKCIVSGGVEPYTYQWNVSPVDNATHYEYAPEDSAIMSLCLVDYETSVMVSCIVTDAEGDSVSTGLKEITCEPSSSITPFYFDMHASPINYDEGYAITNLTTEIDNMKGIYSEWVHYVCRLNISILDDLEEAEISAIVDDLTEHVIKPINTEFLHTRYVASDCQMYNGVNSRSHLAQPQVITLHNITINDTTIDFHIRTHCMTSVTAAIARIEQIIRFYAEQQEINIDINTLFTRGDFEPMLYETEVVENLSSNLDELWAQKYSQLNIDDIFDTVQMDVETYLTNQNKFYRGLGTANIGID